MRNESHFSWSKNQMQRQSNHNHGTIKIAPFDEFSELD